ncbi:hypothetical protein [Pseudoduganella violaceinigra]|uniref:hypothetical protein n=1 Tax=Pseudoduganella violaceinigra TaxID=246602 RepID=UPI0004157E3E|nr:hypothetical protein [Pseudoduganella violaceinigra]
MIRRLLQVLLYCLCFNAQSADIRLVYPRYFTIHDSSLEFDWIVLRAAMEKTAAKFGPYQVSASSEPLSVARLLQEMSRPDGSINIFARATDLDLEKKFNPIRIPIDRGLMGMRLLMVRQADLPRFAAVRTLDDLKRLSAGQGKAWIDTQVLKAAGITVVEAPRADALYAMLEARRFDFFPRALDEAPRELDALAKSRPGIVIEPTLMLRYPLPRYFFVRRDTEGDKLAERIKAGMEMMLRDGTLAALFRQYEGPLVERARIGKRRIIDLLNPALPPETPLQRSELWFRP